MADTNRTSLFSVEAFLVSREDGGLVQEKLGYEMRMAPKFAASLIIWLAGLIVGLVVLVFGALLHSLLLVRGSLLLIAGATTAGAAFRLLAFQASGGGWYARISVGVRLLAAAVLVYAAARFHF